MTKSPLKSFLAAALTLVCAVFLVPQSAMAASGKVHFNAESPALELGGNTDVTISLEQPLICADPGNCSVTIDFASSVPAGVTVTPSSVTWTSSEWSQTRTVNVSIAEDANELFGQTISLGGPVASGSEYYNGYQAAFDVAVLAPVAYNQRTLANTGSSEVLVIGEVLSAGLLISCGIVLLRNRRRSANNA